MAGKLYFQSKKEKREGYFVKYEPPVSRVPLAMLSLTFVQPIAPERVAELMEREISVWLARYPLPLLVFAFDESGSMILLESVRPADCLIGFLNENGEIGSRWQKDVTDEFIQQKGDRYERAEVYADIPFRTQLELDQEIQESNKVTRRQIKLLRVIALTWFAIIPAAILIVGFASYWVGLLAFLYSLYKLGLEVAKILGWRKASAAEKVKSEKEAKLEQYAYHCERNPEGFLRLKAENFQEDSRRQVREEAEAVAKSISL